MKILARVLLGLVLWAAALPALAQDVSDDRKEMARERFARGVERLEAGDYRGAAAEFEAAYALAPFAVIQFNLGLAYEKLDQPVKAVAAMERVVADPGTLSAARVERAKQSIAEQSKRIGKLVVEVSEPGASVRVDGIEIGTSPISAPVPIAAGLHFVEAVKRGFAPGRQETSVAGGEDAKVALALEPTDVSLAQLWIKSRLPDAEVWLDGVRIGKTPLKTTVPVMPGRHDVELRRLGYDTARESIELGAGATADLRLEPSEDQETIRAQGSLLALESEAVDDLVVTVDGKRIGAYGGPIALAPGAHDVGVERGGFEPTTLRVDVPAGSTITQLVVLDPTAETIADHNQEVALYRGFSWAATVTGVALAGAGAGVTVWALGQVSNAEDELAAHPECTEQGQGGAQNPFCVGLANDINSARSKRNGGFAMIGVGGGLLVTGIVLFAVTPDAGKYRREPEEDPFGDASLVLDLGPDGGYAGMSASF
jgi:hypothetical protein